LNAKIARTRPPWLGGEGQRGGDQDGGDARQN
jgi:hypothetical protein